MRAAIDAAARHRPVAGGHRGGSRSDDAGGRVPDARAHHRHGHRTQGDAGPGGRARDRRVQDRRHAHTSGSAWTSTRRIWCACTSARRSRCGPTRGRARRSAGASPSSSRSSTKRRGPRRCGSSSPTRTGVLQAGQLVTARILADSKLATNEVLAVPRSAIEQVEGKTVVFVKTGEGFERRERAARRPRAATGSRSARA